MAGPVGQGMDVKERRQGPDWLTRGLQGLVILCWAGFIVLLSLYHYARPEVAYGFLGRCFLNRCSLNGTN
ncbi:hypothetical protein MT389_17800 [Aeromonas salmonicida]|uniref:hypothetical protein n=1 Tax=Aeromonas salmonicida TaxID=645 RepID=UPI00309A5D83